MSTFRFLGLAFLLVISGTLLAQEQVFKVGNFDKIIISPHIEAVLVQGNNTTVSIEDSKVPLDKINVEVEGTTLRVYLDGAKTVTKSEQVSSDQWKGKRAIYNGTMVTAKITYASLENLSIRGEEVIKCKGTLDGDKLKVSLFGAAKVYFDALDLNELVVAIYGSSYLELKTGTVGRQVYRAYGESEVNALGLTNNETKITAYGESNFRVAVADRLKVTCYGESQINYTGNPTVDNGIIIGEARVRKIR